MDERAAPRAGAGALALFRNTLAIGQECLANVGPGVSLLSREHDRRRHRRVQDMNLVKQMAMVQMRPVQVFPVKHMHVLTVEAGQVMVMMKRMFVMEMRFMRRR